MQIIAFNYLGNRTEFSEKELFRIFDKEGYGKEMRKQFDRAGMLGVNFGTPLEWVFIRKDERCMLNLRKYINFLRQQPTRELDPETYEDLTSRKPYIHPLETPRFRGK